MNLDSRYGFVLARDEFKLVNVLSYFVIVAFLDVIALFALT